MKYVSPLKIKNRQCLNQVVANFPIIAPFEARIWAAYKNYWLQQGNPRTITPVSITEAELHAIKKVFEDCYGAARVRDKLQWIQTYRENHGHAYCPMCGAAHAKTLEHYLPRKYYPEFAFLAFNLVPSCIVCNQHRSASANAPGTVLRMLHPFFDGRKLNEGFLYVSFIPPFEAPEFAASASHTDKAFMPRVTHHLERSIDKNLFQTWILDKWIKLRKEARRKNSIQELSSEIMVRLSDEEEVSGPNTWDAAFLRGILMDMCIIPWMLSNPI